MTVPTKSQPQMHLELDKKEIIILFFVLIFGVVRYFFFIPEKPNLDNFLGNEVSVEGIVSEIPKENDFNIRITVNQNDSDFYFLAIGSKEDNIFYGDKVLVSGELTIPENFDTETGRVFNYRRYLANKNIYYVIENAEIKIIESESRKGLKFWLYKFRNSFRENMGMIINYPNSSLAEGLLLGEKSGFDNNMQDDFVKTGTIHIVALSGYNITIIADNTIKILGSVLSKTLSIIFSFFLILIFIIMTGAEATAVRAGVMASILLLSKIMGRDYYAKRALWIAFILMLAYDLRVISDMSFQLSFLATAGILYIHPKIFPKLYFIPIRFHLREIVSTTISATIAVLPLVLYSTGVLSLVSLPANILILPFIPITMFFSFLAGIISFISPFLAYPFAIISNIFLSYILFIIEWFGSFRFSSVNIESFSVIFVFVIYAFIVWWVIKK